MTSNGVKVIIFAGMGQGRPLRAAQKGRGTAPMAMSDEEKTDLVNSIAKSYETKCIETLGNDLEGFYVFGSYAFGKISLDIPDIN